MNLHSKVRLSGTVAVLSVWLASVSLGACGNTVVVGQSCATACEEANTRGLQYFNVVSSECACDACSDACEKSVCISKETPSDACLPCVQKSVRGDACQGGLFGAGCNGHAECRAFVDCLTACPTQ